MKRFQTSCIHLLGQYKWPIDEHDKEIIRTFYAPKEHRTGVRKLEHKIDELYLYCAVCATRREAQVGITDSQLCLDIICKITDYPKYYYTLINYCSANQSNITNSDYVHQVAHVLCIDLEDVLVDGLLYKEEEYWQLYGYSSLVEVLRPITLVDLEIRQQQFYMRKACS
jgi:hypothetical protein